MIIASPHGQSGGTSFVGAHRQVDGPLILRDAPLRPHKVKYYLERRDPEFDRKMKEVLIVYREVAELEQHPSPAGSSRIATVWVDQKPGVQAPCRNIPRDDAPGATDAGVIHYIDKRLPAGSIGSAKGRSL